MNNVKISLRPSDFIGESSDWVVIPVLGAVKDAGHQPQLSGKSQCHGKKDTAKKGRLKSTKSKWNRSKWAQDGRSETYEKRFPLFISPVYPHCIPTCNGYSSWFPFFEENDTTTRGSKGLQHMAGWQLHDLGFGPLLLQKAPFKSGKFSTARSMSPRTPRTAKKTRIYQITTRNTDKSLQNQVPGEELVVLGVDKRRATCLRGDNTFQGFSGCVIFSIQNIQKFFFKSLAFPSPKTTCLKHHDAMESDDFGSCGSVQMGSNGWL